MVTPQPAPGTAAITPALSHFLDLSRWLAAFMVVFSHVRSLVLVNYADLAPHPGAAVRAVYFLAGFGHQAVVIFFVISGYLVGGRAALKAMRGRLSLRDYATHRFVRIYIVLVPALLTGFLYDRCGSRLIDDFGLYTNQQTFHWWMIDFSVEARLDLPTLLGNLALVQTIFVQPLGSNGPLWSLANEWWYYVAFGLAAGAALASGRARQSLCLGGLALLAAILPLAITLWSVIWLIGVLAAILAARWRGLPAYAGLAIFVAALAADRLLPAPSGMGWDFCRDVALGLAYAVALMSAARGRWAIGSLHPFLASFSYTTYLVHAPAMVLLVATVHRLTGFGIAEQPGRPAFAFMAALTLVLYAYAYMFARATERHTEWARRRLNAALRPTPQ